MEDYLHKAIIYNKNTQRLEIINSSDKIDENYFKAIYIQDKEFCIRQINGIDFHDCALTIIDKGEIDNVIQEYTQYYGQFYDSTTYKLIDEETTFELEMFNVTKRYLNIKLPYVQSTVFYTFEYNTNEYILK